MRAEGEGDERGSEGWVASPIMDMSFGELWVLVMDREPGVLQFMGLQRVRHD